MEAVNNAEKLDSRWYARYEAVVFEDYEQFNDNKENRDEQKNRFLAGEIVNPTFDYPELESFDIDEREEILIELKNDVLELEQNETVKKIYRTKINETLATLRMLRAAKNGDDRKFSRYADFIYGKPEGADVNYIIQHVKELIEVNEVIENKEVQHAIERLKNIFGEIESTIDDGVDKSVLPKGEKKGDLVENIEEAVTAFGAALADLKADDWSVVVDNEKGISSFSVNQEHKIVRVPSEDELKKRAISKRRLKGLVAHEIGTHVARRTNGERSKLQLLGLGLDRYIRAEEGIATYNQQLVEGAKEFAGVPRYLSVAVAKGVDGTPRDFRETFEVMKDYRLLSSTKKNTDAAAEIAYNDCVRIFRGTTCTTPGAIYPKDMAYFGNRAIWALVNKDSDAVEYFSIGKYDPTNEEHVALLSQLGILDEDLEKLEKEESEQS